LAGLVDLVLFVLVGLFTGTVTGVMSASGVIVVVPILTLLFGLSVHMAIGTSLAVDVIASVVVAYTYYQHKNVDLRPGVWVALGAVVGAQVGSRLVTGIPDLGLGDVFGISMIIGGMVLWKQGFFTNFERYRELLERAGINFQEIEEKWRFLISLTAGLVIGILSGIFGAGGGIWVMVVLVFILGYQLHLAVGTSTLIMAAIAFSGSIGYAFNGNVDVLKALAVGFGAVLGGRTVAKIANRVSEEKLSKIIGLIFAVLGFLMILLGHVKA